MVEIRLLGPVQLAAGGQTFDVGPPQRCAVLAALASDAGRLVTADALIDRVWGDSPSALARRALHAHVARLRRLLAEVGAEGEGDAQIRGRAGGYTLATDPRRVDVIEFRHLLAHAEDPGQDRNHRATTLRAAMGLWRGEPLAGLTGAWAARTREGWRRLHLQAARAWAGAEIDVGRAASVVEPMSELLHANPFDEHLAAALMRALHAAGDRAAALRLYSTTRARLVDELGVDPGPELQRTHREVLGSDEDRQTEERRASWPHQVGVPPPRADGFLHRAVADEIAAAADGPAVQVLSGLGGVGKTQLAAEVSRTRWTAGRLDLLIWVTVTSRDAVVTAYARCADDLALGPRSEPPEQAAVRLLTWLATTTRRWLVVLDDLSRPADVHDLWPPEHPTGATVVTTRRRDAALSAGRVLHDIGVFRSEEAVAYLSRKLPSRLGDDLAGVVADLGALPLALSHAAAYMVDQDISCGEYRIRFADREQRLSRLFPEPDSLFDGTARTVATTWTISMEAANRLAPTGVAAPLLELAALLDPNGIPETVLTSAAARAYLARRLGRGHDEATTRDGLRCLHRFHLITHERAVVRVHALVQRVVRESLDDARTQDLGRVAADALHEVWPVLDHHTGHLLRANVAALDDHSAGALVHPEHGAHPVLARTVDSFGAAAQLDRAVTSCRGHVERAAAVLGTAHPDTFRLTNLLLTWTADAGGNAEAVARLEKLAVRADAALGPDHPVTIDIHHTLGYQRGWAGDPHGAVAGLTDVTDRRIRVLGADDPTVIGCRNQLAYWLSKAGDAVRARADLEQLLPHAVRILGADHHDVLEVRGNLAHCRGFCGDVTGAIADFTALLADSRRITGTRPRATSVIRHNLAMWHWRAGNTDEATRILREVVVERLDLFGPEHRDTLVTRHALAAIAAERNEPGAADDLVATLADCDRAFGPDHQFTLHLRHDLASLRGRLGDAGRAAAELGEVYRQRQRVLGADHADTLASRNAYLHWRDLAGTDEGDQR